MAIDPEAHATDILKYICELQKSKKLNDRDKIKLTDTMINAFKAVHGDRKVVANVDITEKFKQFYDEVQDETQNPNNTRKEISPEQIINDSGQGRSEREEQD